MSAPTTRRDLLVGGTTVAALAAVAVTPASGAGPNPDAELIRVCAQHCINMDAYNDSDAGESGQAFASGPLWAAYCETRNFISSSKPQTMDGILAKARAARHEANYDDDDWSGTMGEAWAPDIINDLLRVTGGAA